MTMKPELNIKLVAIAKDEAAYLPEWIFHHLYFGFDQIDIYVNNTSDNTFALKEGLSELDNVNLIEGDAFFIGQQKAPQQAVYQHAYHHAQVEGFTHVMFLDIDEFWTPQDLCTTIHQCVSQLDGEVLSFEWLNKFESKPFASAMSEQIEGEHHNLVKSLISTEFDAQDLDIHNIKSSQARNLLADGSPAQFNEKKQKLAHIGDLKAYFILHRMYRSPLEYVSLLGRGRPTSSGSTQFKDNRNGFCFLEHQLKNVTLPTSTLATYQSAKSAFFEQYLPAEYLTKAQQFVEQRYKNVVNLIANANLTEFKVIQKILRNVDTPEVNTAFAQYLARVSDHLAGQVTDSLRDAAINLENRDLNKSLTLMKTAQQFRPRGQLINRKIREYQNKLK